jgi:HEAT repeat protein
MSENLNKTFQYLAQTDNEAAVEVLISGLDSPYKPTCEGSLSALLKRQSAVGYCEVFRRLPTMDERMRSIIQERPERLIYIIAEVLHGSDLQSHRSAYEMLTEYRLYDAIPALVSRLLDLSNPDRAQTAQAILKLTDLFYKELSEAANPQDFDRPRTNLTTCLKEAVRKYHRHKQKEVIEAFLLLARTNNSTLKHILTHSEDAAYDPMLKVLAQSTRGGVKRLLLAFLTKSQIPKEIIQVISERCDPEFMSHVLHLVAKQPSKTLLETLIRFKQFAWAEPGHEIFEKLDETAQAGAVRLLIRSAMSRAKVGKVIEYLLVHGNAGGRRAAAEALEQFPSEETDAIILAGLHDNDPAVLVPLLVQLRPRKIPGALERLLGMVDHPDPGVKEALRKALPEFSIHKFLQQVHNLSEELIRPTACLVRKLNPDCIPLLSAEMQSNSPVRRRHAILAAGAMGLASEIEPQITGLLSDDDDIVRKAAAKVLTDCPSNASI